MLHGLRRVTALALSAIFIVAGVGAATAQEASTPEDAKALVKAAIDHWNEVGHEQAVEDFNSGEAPWIEHDLYVIIFDEEGVFHTHANPGLRGQNLWDLQDINGFFIIRDMVAAAMKGDGGAWSNYVWMNPATDRQEQKWTWNEENDGMFFAVGAYGQDPMD